MDHFNKKYDIDGMLYETAEWLSRQTGLGIKDFVDIAKKIDLRQEDWDIFWKKVQDYREGEEVEVCIDNDYRMSNKDFRILKSVLGEPIYELSNCCGADVYPHNADDHTSRCTDCQEGCGIVYQYKKVYEGELYNRNRIWE
jgi:hypothetical protein